MHYQIELKYTYPLWSSVCQGTYPKETLVCVYQEKTYKNVHCTLFLRAKNYKNSKAYQIEKQINTFSHTDILEYQTVKTVCAMSLQLCLTPCNLQIIAHQDPLSMGFSRQEYWSWLPCPPPEDLPNPEIEPMSLMSPALAGGFFTSSTTGEGQSKLTNYNYTRQYYHHNV